MRRQRGLTYIETLVATAIVTVTMLGTVGILVNVGTLTSRTSERSTAMSLARRGIEEAKDLGFANLAEGTITRYYDVNGSGGLTTATPSTDQFKVATAVSSDALSGGVPTQTALRTVTVTVSRASDNTVLEKTGTYLAWGGP